MEEVTLVVAFGAGLLSFASPCVLPVVPVYFASLSGVDTLEPVAGRKRLTIFRHSLSFVIGFSALFVLLGAGAGLLGFAIGQNLPVVRKISGSLLVVFGLYMLAALKVPWLNYEKHLSPARVGSSHMRSLLTGGVFAIAWTPCVGPILGGILAFAMSSETMWQGAYLLSVYSLGLAVPFLAAGALFDVVNPLLRRLNRYALAFHVVSAVLLIAVGVLVLTDNLTWLQRFAI